MKIKEARNIEQSFINILYDTKSILENPSYKTDESKIKRVMESWHRQWGRTENEVEGFSKFIIRSIDNMMTRTIANELGVKNIERYIEVLHMMLQLYDFKQEDDGR